MTPRGDPERTLLFLAHAFLALAVAATLATALSLVFYAHPNGDDFCLAADVRLDGAWACIRNAYLEQGGRWAGYSLGCGLKSVVELTRQYPWGLLVLIGTFLVSVRFFATAVLTGADRRLGWTLSVIFVALYWSGMPDPGSSFYWFDSGVVYLFNITLGLVLVACLARMSPTPSPRRSLGILALALLAFTITAFHEVYGLILAGVLAVGFCACLLLGDSRRVAWGGVALGAVLGLVTVVVAPGNEVRSRGVQPAEVKSIATGLYQTVWMWLRVLDAPVSRGEPLGSHGAPLGWVTDPRLLSATLVFVLSPRVRSLRPEWVLRAPNLWKAVVPLVWLGALTGAFLVGGWALGRMLPLRVFNGLYLVFLVGWFLTAFVYTRWERQPDWSHPLVRLLRPAAVVLLALGLLTSTSLKQAVRDVGKGAARAYDVEMHERYVRARELHARGGGDLVVGRLDEWPSSFYANDVRDDPEDVRNQCWERYFQLDSIRIPGAPEDGSPARR